MGMPCRPRPLPQVVPGESARGYYRPRVERLEAREMLTNLGLDIQLLRDNNGSPGDALTALQDGGEANPHDAIQQGETFWVQIVAWDQPSDTELPTAAAPSPGVISLPLNIAWDVTKLEFVGVVPPAPPAVPLDNALLTPNFHEQRLVSTIDLQAVAPNVNLVNLRAGTIPAAAGDGLPIGRFVVDGIANQDTWFSRLRFRALVATDSTPFVMQLAGAASFDDQSLVENVLHVVGPSGSSTRFENAGEDLRVTENIRIAAAGTISLSGFVFIDPNLNGTFDRDASGAPTEIGLPGVTVSLSGAASRVAITGADGAYHFEDLPAGTYAILETQPAHFVDAAISLGDILPAAGGTLPSTISKGATSGVNQFTGITLADRTTGVDYNFAENAIPDKRFFFTSADSRSLIVGQLGIGSLTIDATGDVQISADDTQLTVTAAGQSARQFSLATTRLLTVRAPNANVQLSGTAGDDLADLAPGASALRRGIDYSGVNFGVVVLGAQNVSFAGGAGNDRAVVRDSPLSDALAVTGGSATLSNAQAQLRVTGFDSSDTVRAISLTRSGVTESDTITNQAHDFVLDLVGKWTI
jgi:hypothetical protein